MSDLVERLRECAEPNNFARGSLYGACRQAAAEIETLRSQLVKARSDVLWAHGFNSCLHTAISALNYLSSHTRPIGGQDAYNSEHLLQIADEIKRTIAHNVSAFTDEKST